MPGVAVCANAPPANARVIATTTAFALNIAVLLLVESAAVIFACTTKNVRRRSELTVIAVYLYRIVSAGRSRACSLDCLDVGVFDYLLPLWHIAFQHVA